MARHSRSSGRTCSVPRCGSGPQLQKQAAVVWNCGVESSRQLINQATATNVDENDLLDDAINHGDADDDADPDERGGTSPDTRQSLLARHSVSSSLQEPTLENITQAVAETKGVISSQDVSGLWGVNYSGGHAVVTTGVEYNADGTLKSVIINDTGEGRGSRAVLASRYQRSLTTDAPLSVTDDPIW